MSNPTDPKDFGPDATLSAIAKWLTKNMPSIDRLFSEVFAITHIRVFEEMTEQHPQQEHEMVCPQVKIAYATPDGNLIARHFETQLRRFELCLGENGALLKQNCVIRDKVFYQEVLDLTIWRGGVVLGSVRYANLANFDTEPDYEIAEQYFVWLRRGQRYVGEQIEFRLWGLYIPDFLREGQADLATIKERPASLLDHPEILPGAESGYAALYHMRRPPTSIDYASSYISVFYQGENAELQQLLAA